MRRPWRLTTKLVLALVMLFLAVTAVTAAATVLVTREQQVNRIDADLGEQARFQDGREREGDSPDSDACETRGPGVGEGMLRVCVSTEGSTGYLVSGGTYATLDGAVAAQVLAAASDQPATVHIDGLGAYRVLATESPQVRVVTGIPMSSVDEAVGNLVQTVVVATLIGAALTIVGGGLMVRHTLQPLVRVAATARDVSGMDLSRGEVHLPDRVAPELADPTTEVGQVGRALNSLLDNVSFALKSRQRSESRLRTFAADASHELRTPLAAIRGYAELSRRTAQPVPAETAHALGRIEAEATRMTGLVEDLLLLASLDAGRELEQEPVDLTLLAIDSVSDARAISSRHRWMLDLPEEPVTLVGDSARLRQVFTNLLSNARNHTPPGTSVVTTVRVEPDWVVLMVSDDGPGIPPKFQQEMFERFTRGDESRQRATGSTGLGMSIVKAIVEAHGGTVQVRSNAGGSDFIVRLPRVSD